MKGQLWTRTAFLKQARPHPDISSRYPGSNNGPQPPSLALTSIFLTLPGRSQVTPVAFHSFPTQVHLEKLRSAHHLVDWAHAT